MHIAIRLAVAKDAVSLADVYAASSTPTVNLDAEHYATILSDSRVSVYVAEVSDSVVGFLILERTNHSAVQARHPIKLWQVYVVPDFHGSGVATELMRVAQDHAREQGHDVMWLGVSAHNARAIAFYLKHGFEPLGLHEVGGGEHTHQDIVMSWSLPV